MPSFASAPQPSDGNIASTILARIADGDERALRELFDAHYPALVRFAEGYLRMHAGTETAAIAEAADEIVCDVFVRLWRARGKLAVATTLERYLFGAVRNRALTHLSRSARARSQSARLEQYAEREGSVPGMGSTSPDGAFADTPAKWDALHQAIETLAPGRRLVLELRWRDGRSFAEIAELLGVSVRSVETQHLRAMKDLRRRLENPE
jgi:RNA polymerase sigma-70 factor, ECF subfamily